MSQLNVTELDFATIKENLLQSNYGSSQYSDVKLGFLAYGGAINQADFYSALILAKTKKKIIL